MFDALIWTPIILGIGLCAGLTAAAVETAPDIHELARNLARKAADIARRLAVRDRTTSDLIGARVLAMCAFEIRELSRMAAGPRGDSGAQEIKLRAACLDVATKLADDARSVAP